VQLHSTPHHLLASAPPDCSYLLEPYTSLSGSRAPILSCTMSFSNGCAAAAMALRCLTCLSPMIPPSVHRHCHGSAPPSLPLHSGAGPVFAAAAMDLTGNTWWRILVPTRCCPCHCRPHTQAEAQAAHHSRAAAVAVP